MQNFGGKKGVLWEMCTWQINRQEIEQLGRSFSSIVIFYPVKETMGQVHDTWGIPRTPALRHSNSLESELNCAFFFPLATIRSKRRKILDFLHVT